VELLLRAAVSGVIIAAASEVARRSTLLGAVIVSLPLTSMLAIIWLYRAGRDTEEVASFAWSILWVIVPSLVFFVALPLLLRGGLTFWLSLLLASTATAVAYGAWVLTGRALSVGD
jgi:F0F1-type ATP synthase assembly protein I